MRLFALPFRDVADALGHPIHACKRLGQPVSDLMVDAGYDISMSPYETESPFRTQMVLRPGRGGAAGMEVLVRFRADVQKIWALRMNSFSAATRGFARRVPFGSAIAALRTTFGSPVAELRTSFGRVTTWWRTQHELIWAVHEAVADGVRPAGHIDDFGLASLPICPPQFDAGLGRALESVFVETSLSLKEVGSAVVTTISGQLAQPQVAREAVRFLVGVGFARRAKVTISAYPPLQLYEIQIAGLRPAERELLMICGNTIGRVV